MSDSDLERIEKELDSFMEWHANDRGTVTRAGWLLFAEYMQQKAIKERDEALDELERMREAMSIIQGIVDGDIRAEVRDSIIMASAGSPNIVSGLNEIYEYCNAIVAIIDQQQAEGE